MNVQAISVIVRLITCVGILSFYFFYRCKYGFYHVNPKTNSYEKDNFLWDFAILLIAMIILLSP